MVKLFVLITTVLMTTGSWAEPKAMDCGECRIKYGENAPCEPICGGELKKGAEYAYLYRHMNRLMKADCGEGYCTSRFEEVTCQWADRKKRDGFKCTITGEDGRVQVVQGEQAKILSNAITGLGKVNPGCEKGLCSFDHPQTLVCTQLKTGMGKTAKYDYECSAMVHLKVGASSSDPSSTVNKAAAPEKSPGKK